MSLSQVFNLLKLNIADLAFLTGMTKKEVKRGLRTNTGIENETLLRFKDELLNPVIQRTIKMKNENR